MTEPRLKAEIWVKAVLRQATSAGRFGAVLRRGDTDAGGVLVVLRHGDTLSVLSQARGPDGALGWLRATGSAAVDQVTADAYVARQVKFDPDLWVVEFDSPDMLPPFEAKIL